MDKKNDDKMTIMIDISDSLANSIRRYVNEIQVLAVNEVEIIKNDSALYDETIAHRIGLIPLKNEKTFDEKKGGQLKLSVSKEGKVYSKDLKGSLSVVYENMPITNLEKDQEIELIAEVNYGKGIEHAKYIPGFMYYKNLKEIKSGSKGQEINDILSHCVNYCGEEMKIENNKNYTINLCEQCEERLESLGVEMGDSEKIVIILESFGQMPTKEIFLSSIKTLKKDLVDLSKKVDKA